MNFGIKPFTVTDRTLLPWKKSMLYVVFSILRKCSWMKHYQQSTIQTIGGTYEEIWQEVLIDTRKTTDQKNDHSASKIMDLGSELLTVSN